jgi:C-methyltransferase C-terminal domain/Putative zinc binding domain/Methyltransferase domain
VPLANGFLKPTDLDEPEATYPLGLRWCRVCGLVQLTFTVAPEILFREYLYTPSASSTWRRHCEELAQWAAAEADLQRDALVVEPASNDGCLLREFLRFTPAILGVDPARNIAAEAAQSGIPTMPEFFTEETARRIQASRGDAALVIGTNVLAHVPDILDFLRGARLLIGGTGAFVIEAPYLRDLVESVAYDTIYHEHVSYLSVTALSRIYPLAGLALTHVERTPVHGGSIRFVGRATGALPDESVQRFLDEEAVAGYADGSVLANFAQRVERLRGNLATALRQEVLAGRRIAAYGATAKGNTLLTTCDIDPHAIRYIVDKNPLKQGRLTPGTHIRVVGPELLKSDPVDTLVILAWNIADEIVKQQDEFRQGGGRFLVPIPEPHFID